MNTTIIKLLFVLMILTASATKKAIEYWSNDREERKVDTTAIFVTKQGKRTKQILKITLLKKIKSYLICVENC